MREIGWRSVGTAVVEWAAGGDGSGAEEVFGGGSQGFARGWWPGRTVVVGWGVAVGDGSEGGGGFWGRASGGCKRLPVRENSCCRMGCRWRWERRGGGCRIGRCRAGRAVARRCVRRRENGRPTIGVKTAKGVPLRGVRCRDRGNVDIIGRYVL